MLETKFTLIENQCYKGTQMCKSGTYFIENSKGETIAYIPKASGKPNAVLMSKAPELYSALRYLSEVVKAGTLPYENHPAMIVAKQAMLDIELTS